jgi:hypothetical protein
MKLVPHNVTQTHTHSNRRFHANQLSSTMSKTNAIIQGWAKEKRKNIISRKTPEQ